jgi:hypothetical protein
MWINDRTLLISGYGRFDRGWSPLKRADLPAFWVSCVVWRVRCDGFEFGDELAQAAVGGEVGAEPLGVLGGEGLGDGAGAGFAGSGKSGIAESVAYELRLGSVLRWHVTSHTTLEEAVYRYDALGRLQDNQLHPGQDDITKFLRLGPLGTALLGAGPPRVLLIDELDKGELDLPSNLLNVLERGEYEIPELNRLGEGPFRIRAFDSDDTHAITGGRVQCTVFPILVSSIAPDELAALIRVALVAVGQEDRDPVCIRDALWLAATMNAADRGPAGQARPGTNIWRRRPSQKPLAAAEGRNAERSALLEGEPGSGAAELFDDGDHGSPRPAQGIPARRVTLGGPSSLLSTLELARALRPFRQTCRLVTAWRSI